MERAKKWWNLFCIVRNDQFEWFMWSKQELSCANCGHHIIQSENFRFIFLLELEITEMYFCKIFGESNMKDSFALLDDFSVNQFIL